jgi:hypothetical protein
MDYRGAGKYMGRNDHLYTVIPYNFVEYMKMIGSVQRVME